MGERPPFHVVITAGYTPLDEDERLQEVKALRDTYGEEYVMGQDKALKQYDGKPVVLFPLKAALESEAASVTVVGSRELGRDIGDLLEQIKTSNPETQHKPFAFREMHYPREGDGGSDPSLRRMRLDEICIAENIRKGRDAFPEEGFRAYIGADLPRLTGPVITKAFEQCAPFEDDVYYSLIAKETLGRLRRNYLSVVDDKWGSDIHPRDQYGRVKLKESNCLIMREPRPDGTIDFVGSLFSLRKLNDYRSAKRALEVLGPDAPLGDVPGLGSLSQRALGLCRVAQVAYKYVLANLSITWTEDLIRRISGENFSFFEMNSPEFSIDQDSEEDFANLSFMDKDSIKAELGDVVRRVSAYKGTNIMLEGYVRDVTYEAPRPLAGGTKGTILSLLGYKSLSFELSDGTDTIHCYRSKDVNPLRKALTQLTDHLYIKDSEFELLEGVEKSIDEVLTLPQFKYERIVKRLEESREAGEPVYVSGRMTPHGLWVHELVAGPKKFFFRYHCADPRCSDISDYNGKF